MAQPYRVLRFAQGHMMTDRMLAVALDEGTRPVKELMWGEGVGTMTRRERFRLAMQIPPQLRAWEAEGGVVGVRTFTAALRATAALGDPKTSEALYREMVKKGLVPPPEVYEPLARAYALSADVDGVYDVLGRMKRQGLRPAAKLYQCAIIALGKNGEEAMAVRCFNAVVKEGLDVTAQLVADTVQACHDPAAAEDVLLRAEGYGVPLCIRLYNSVLQIYLRNLSDLLPPPITPSRGRQSPEQAACRAAKGAPPLVPPKPPRPRRQPPAGATAEGTRAAGVAFARGIPVAKNVVTYNLLMKLHGLVGDLAAVLRTYKLAVDAEGVTPTVHTYGALMAAVTAKTRKHPAAPEQDREVQLAELAYRQALRAARGTGLVNLQLKLAELYAAAARPDALQAFIAGLAEEDRKHRHRRRPRRPLHPMFEEYLDMARQAQAPLSEKEESR